jgi:hypothetical protein
VYYYQDDEYSSQLANFFVQSFIDDGSYNGTAHNRTDFEGSWAKGHYLPWAGYRLGWIERTTAFAQLFECGYIAGRNSDEDLEEHGKVVANAIAKLFGRSIESTKTENTANTQPQPPMVVVKDTQAIKDEKTKQEELLTNVSNNPTKDDMTESQVIPTKIEKERFSLGDFILGMFKNGTVELYLTTIMLAPATNLLLNQLNLLSQEGNIFATIGVWVAGAVFSMLKMHQATQIKVAKINNPLL